MSVAGHNLCFVVCFQVIYRACGSRFFSAVSVAVFVV